MGKTYPQRDSFNGGKQTPKLRGHTRAPRSDSAYTDGLNVVPSKYGPLDRRGGTERISGSNSSGWSGKKSHMLKFEYNDEQVYQLEFSYQSRAKLRVYVDKALVLVPGTLDGAGIGYQTITAIENLGPSPFQVDVADATGFTINKEVSFSVSSGATELDGKVATVVAVNTGSVDIEFFGLPDYTNGAISGTIREVFEIDLPYSDADLFKTDGTFRIDVTRSNDVMYLYHPDYNTRILARTADDVWTLTKSVDLHGPFLDDNDNTDIVMACDEWVVGTDADSNPINLSRVRARDLQDKTYIGWDGVDTDVFVATDAVSVANGGLPNQLGAVHSPASGATFTNGGTGSEAGRQLKVLISGSSSHSMFRWRYLTIVAFISDHEVWVTRDDDEPRWSTASKYHGAPNQKRDNIDQRAKQWALGAFSSTTGFPSTCAIHDARVVAGNTAAEPRTVHATQTGFFSDTRMGWETHDRQGNVFNDFGFKAHIGGGDSAPIQWLETINRQLGVGTTGHVGSLRAIDEKLGFAPGNIGYASHVNIGSKSIQPIRVNNTLIFVSRSGRKLYELSYDLASNGLDTREITELAEDATRSGIIDIAYQQEPEGFIWLVLADGSLTGVTYDRKGDILAVHEHNLGGQNQSTSGALNDLDSHVRSISVIPTSDGLSEELWLIVDRQTNAGLPSLPTSLVQRVTGSVEVMSPIHDDTVDIKDATLYDSYLKTSSTIVAMGIASDGEITSGTVPANNTIVLISGSVPTTGYTDEPENHYYKIENGGTDYLRSISGGAVDFGQAFTANLQPVSTTFSGLEIFAGKTISICADGRKLDDQIVYSGDNILANAEYGANVIFGYDYKSWVEIQNIEGGQPGASTQGRLGTIIKLFIRVMNSLGVEYGDSEANLIEVDFDEDADISEYLSLKTGDYILNWDGEFDPNRVIRLQGDGPYPFSIQALVADMKTEDFSSG